MRHGCLALALAASLPAAAAEPLPPGIRALQWHDAGVPDVTAAKQIRHDDVWERVRDGFRIDDSAQPNPLVAVHEAWFADRPQNVRRLLERARPYLYHIVEELDQRAMPMEIALLPMIESAFNPTALSPSAASGIWQFIPSTGRLYGLKQDSWYDGRRDFTEATRAALDYLGKLYLDFGDWRLALAAYNCGEGCVARAIRKNVELGLPTDYASLSLPNETRHYVPKLLAVCNIVGEPERFGITVEPLANRPHFDQVTVHASLDVQSAARLAGVSSDEFLALNAAFPRKIIRSDTPVNLLVPVEKADEFQRNLASGDWDSWQPYAAQKGERPQAIAQRFGTTVARLDAHNQMQVRHGKLVRAQTLLVPVKGRDGPATREVTSSTTRHEVQRGDTLYGIARRHGLAIDQLVRANPGLSGDLRPGQVLRLSPDKEAAAELPPGAVQRVGLKVHTERPAQPVHYTVGRGDTLYGIARRFDVSLADLASWNPGTGRDIPLRPGQRLVVNQP